MASPVSRFLALALCLTLVGEPFAAELPKAPEAAEAPAPAAAPPLTGAPQVFDAALSAPTQLSLPGLSGEPPAAQSVLAARAAGNAEFDAQVSQAKEATPAVPVSEVSAVVSSPAPLSPSSPGRGGGGRWRPWVPHAITGLNLASGIGSIVLSAHGMTGLSAAMIALAALFDGFDGMAARALGVAGPMGVMMDSQADGVSFGAAPAVLAFSAALGPLAHGHPALMAAGFGAAAFSGFAAAYRLSRYNLDALAAGADKKPSAFFKGLPSPGGAVALIALTFALPALPAAAAFPVAAVGTIAVGALMMSRLPYLKATTSRKTLLLSAAAALAIGAPMAALGFAALAPAALVGAYLLSGPAVALYRGGGPAWKSELRRKAFHQSNLLYLAGFLAGKALVGGRVIAGFVALTAAIGFVEHCRLNGAKLRAFLERSIMLKSAFAWLESVKREKEDHQPSGVFFGALGATAAAALSVWLGDWRLMAGAVLALAFGDTVSPLVGMRFGWKRYRVGGTLRSMDGTIAGFLVSSVIALALGFSWPVALGAAIVFSLVDTYPVKPDDNLWIPIAYPAALALLSWVARTFGGPAAGLAAAVIGAVGAALIARKTSKP